MFFLILLAGTEVPAENDSEVSVKPLTIEENIVEGDEKKKKKKNKNKVAGKVQTNPPTIPISELFPDGV